MDEIELISEAEVKKTTEDFSIEELYEYKKKLLDYVAFLEVKINKKIKKKKEAEEFFK